MLLGKMVRFKITLTKTVTAEDGSVTTETVGKILRGFSSDNNCVNGTICLQRCNVSSKPLVDG